MTAALRKPLLNSQISAEARRIAHNAIRSCAKTHELADAWHSPACNRLKKEIEALALGVKCAAAQPPPPKEGEAA